MAYARTALAALTLLPLYAHAQISFHGTVSEDGRVHSEYRLGNAPVAPPEAAWSLGTVGNVPTCEIEDLGDDAYQITVVSQREDLGQCLLYQTFDPAADREIRVRIVSQNNNGQSHFGAGLALWESDDPVITDYAAYIWRTPINGAGSKSIEGGEVVPPTTYGTAAADMPLPMCLLLQIDNSANEIRTAESGDCETYTQVGVSRSRTLSYPITLAVMSTSHSLALSSAFQVDQLALSGTLTELNQPPDPDPEPPASGTPPYDDPLDGVTLLGQQTINVANNTALTSELNATTVCGKTLVLASGAYNTGRTFNAAKFQCQPDNPLIIRGVGYPSWSTTTTANWNLYSSSNVHLQGLHFTSGGLVRCFGYNNHILGNRWTESRQWAVVGGNNPAFVAGSHCEIAYNEFSHPQDWSGSEHRQAIKTYNTGNQPQNVPTDWWIHHNHIHRWIPKPGGSQGDAIEFGTSFYAWLPTLETGHYVEYNLLHDLGQSSDTWIDNKHGGVIVRFNTILNTDGGQGARPSSNMRIGFRIGSFGIAESNYHQSGGVRIHGRGHTAVCNRSAGGDGVRVYTGNLEWDHATIPPFNSRYPRAYQTLVAGNVGNLFVGVSYGFAGSPAAYLSADATTIEAHTGSITLGSTANWSGEGPSHTNTVDNRSAALTSYECEVPNGPILNHNQVGPAAMPNAPAAWRAPRGL